MIRINKGPAPQKLAKDGIASAQAHCDAYDAHPIEYRAGTKKFVPSQNIFAHPTVKEALEKAQHQKCCYCEAKIDKPYAYWHVEHWRPKAYSQQERKGEKFIPGYYWLSYDWANLFLACPFCNSGNKGNVFPLFDPANRARDHHADLTTEEPLLVKPDEQDPQDHIKFHREVPIGITAVGKKTVAILGLDRTEHASRLKLLKQLQLARGSVLKYADDTALAALEIVAVARAFIEGAIQPDAPFSAMAKAFLDANPLP